LPVSPTLREFVISTRISCEEQAKTLEAAPVDFAALDKLCLQILEGKKI
jgi:hypothetical protein